MGVEAKSCWTGLARPMGKMERDKRTKERLSVPEHEEQPSGEGVCVDLADVHREEHDYLIDSRAGKRCCWCWKLQRMDSW